MFSIKLRNTFDLLGDINSKYESKISNFKFFSMNFKDFVPLKMLQLLFLSILYFQHVFVPLQSFISEFLWKLK